MLDEGLQKSYQFESKFWFWCDLEGHEGERKFMIDMGEIPEVIPECSICPDCVGNRGLAMLTYPIPHRQKISGSPKPWSDVDKRAYTKEFQKKAIIDTTDSIEGRTGISPYSVFSIDYKYMQENNILRKTTPAEEASRIRLAQELAKTIEPAIDQEEAQHGLGRRSNG